MTLKNNDLFGQFAFLTGSTHQTVATVTEDCRLEIFPRADFEELLQTSPEFLEATKQIIQ